MTASDPRKDGAGGHPLEAAADRFIRAQQGGQAPESDDPVERSEDTAVAHAWAAVGEISSTPEMIRVREAALRNASRAASRRRRSGMARWPTAASIAAAILVLIAVPAAGYLLNHRPPPQAYEAPLGERRVVTLPDKSKVFLDEGAQISVSYWRRGRDIELVRGQAEFDVVKDKLRPFAVLAAGRRVVATGTLFSVDLLAGETIVTLLHGRVIVETGDGKAGQGEVIPLNPAERLVIDRDRGEIQKVRIDLADAQAWKSGKIIFERERLRDAVARVNRYASRKIILAAPDQGGEPVTGVFRQGDPTGFAEVVAAQLRLRSQVTPDAIILLNQ